MKIVRSVMSSVWALTLGASPKASYAVVTAQNHRIQNEPDRSNPVQKAHLELLKSKRPTAFEKAERRLTARGFTPTDRVVVFRTGAVAPANFAPVQSVETTEGEIVFWSWDDGDDSTWEGTMWLARYSNGAELLQEAQFDVATTTPTVTYESTIWRKPPDLEYADTLSSGRQQPLLVASLNGVAASPQIELASSMPRPAREWLGCVINGCLVGAVACVFTGPAFPECVVVVCAAVKLGCTVPIILTYL
ncbi:MAG: hypothetical protein ACTHQM_03620 [Thermoanaerobaculia bacterium]